MTKHRAMPTPREAAQLAEQLAAAEQAGLVANIEMTKDQFVEFKKQLWWGRELYTPLGLNQLFPGLRGVTRPAKPAPGVPESVPEDPAT